MKGSPKKKIALLACAGVLALGLAACGSGTNAAASGSASASTASSASTTSSASAATSASSAASASGQASSAAKVDVSNVDFDVAAMSQEDAFTFMHDFTNRTPDALDADEGKVMHIVGQVSRYAKTTNGERHASFSVGIKGEGGTIWGVNVYVEGWTEDDYPANKAQVEVTGVWTKVEGYGNAAGRTLVCNPEDVKVLS